MRRWLLAGCVAGALVACAGPAAPRVYQPSAPPTARAHVDNFILEISSPQETWTAGEPITVTATLTYARPAAITIIGAGSGPIAFGVREIGGTREMGAFLTSDAVPHVIGPEPYVVEYGKSGGWSPADPNEAFYEDFFADPEFRLPPGRWEVTALARFATEDGGPYEVDARVGLVLTVE